MVIFSNKSVLINYILIIINSGSIIHLKDGYMIKPKINMIVPTLCICHFLFLSRFKMISISFNEQQEEKAKPYDENLVNLLSKEDQKRLKAARYDFNDQSNKIS